MDKKKYYLVYMPLMTIIGVFLIFYLPADQSHYVLLIPIIFWIVYYSWNFVEKKGLKNRDSTK
ncbi:hypothetical protein [Calidifontibacillus oryziterrae]|uniref:hypothetical protein n=1 Tax=Calidifontibacillus oryziterrae TaxID=1191699 RepID=UPI00031BF463|nr:hypothetical protein [Calidifontibacillus oryziterrae]